MIEVALCIVLINRTWIHAFTAQAPGINMAIHAKIIVVALTLLNVSMR